MVKQEPILVHGELTDSFYIVTRYKTLPNGGIVAQRKYDVTENVLGLRKTINRIWRNRRKDGPK